MGDSEAVDAAAPPEPFGDRLGEHAGLYNGFANALATAFEMVAIPTVFVLVGFWLDGRFGTAPIVAVALGVLGVVGVAVKAYYAYQATIERVEEGKPWRR